MTDYKDLLTDRFVAAADILSRHVYTVGLDEWEGMDMTIPQIKTLVLLERNGPSRMGTIAEYLDRALSATTTVVDRLVEKGMVDRAWDPSDRRVVICKLTVQGSSAIERFWRIRRERLQEVVDALGVDQLETVVQGLEMICATRNNLKAVAATTNSSL